MTQAFEDERGVSDARQGAQLGQQLGVGPHPPCIAQYQRQTEALADQQEPHRRPAPSPGYESLLESEHEIGPLPAHLERERSRLRLTSLGQDHSRRARSA